MTKEIDILDELDQLMQTQWDYILENGDGVNINVIYKLEEAQKKMTQLEIYRCLNHY